MFVPSIILVFTLTTILVSGSSSALSSSSVIRDGSKPSSTYRAAVYEHVPFLPTANTDTREEALEVMAKNLEVYRAQARKAKEQGAQIIVFPEDGIYGWRFSTRKSVLPFLETIPDPKVTTWSPCSDPERYPDTEVQHALSCMAKENRLYVVANMGDLLPCDGKEDTKCPKDQGYQYNTNVAYDPEGTLVAKYHKVNLYFEPQFNRPEPQVVYFDTPFGRFGMLVCFDLLFSTPAQPMLKEYNIANIAYPTAWMDALPLLSAIGYHSSFARGSGVNFLAANIHMPSKRLQGSGIYTPKGVKKYYYDNDPNSPGKLLVSTLDVLGSNGGVEDIDIQNKHTSIINPLNGISQEFYSSLLHDQYKFRILDGATGNISICHNNLCCSLDYQISEGDGGNGRSDQKLLDLGALDISICHKNMCCSFDHRQLSKKDGDRSDQELFALGVFDGLHTHHGQYYLQTCTLVKCGNNQDILSCGHYTLDTNTKFRFLSLTGTFQTKFVYPQVIMAKDRQLRVGEESSWSFKDNILTSQGDLNDPLLAATLLGRYYKLDQN